eukprot:2601339-Prymnesium_polylepis.1
MERAPPSGGGGASSALPLGETGALGGSASMGGSGVSRAASSILEDMRAVCSGSACLRLPLGWWWPFCAPES